MLFLVILGGLLVIFSYLSRLLSYEEMDRFGRGYLIFRITVAVLVMIPGGGLNSFRFGQTRVNNDSIYLVNRLFLPIRGKMYCVIVFYLLLSLICVVNITKTKEGPLRLRA